MRKLFFFLVLLCVYAWALPAKESAVTLRFDEAGRFRIAQFTDLHWSHRSPNCATTVATIKHILDTEKPHLAILTGDVVTDAPAREAWQAIAAIFAETKIPFAVTMGNHDAEAGISRKEIFALLKDRPYFVGEEGPADIYGTGNYVLPVMRAQSADVAALLYCFDSNDYPAQTKYGHYDWIRFDQIEWYRKISRHYTQANGGVPLPALSFFHIPLPEYDHVERRHTTLGTKGEGNASPKINSGLFASLVEMGDVMGIFAGHDHDNDFIGIEYDIALAFGRVTGTDAYGKLERGARIIELYQDKFRFDTWIRTPSGKEQLYYFPSGLSAADETGMQYLPALEGAPSKQGVSYIYYEGDFQSTSQMTQSEPVGKGTMPALSIREAPREDHFGYEFRTWINIPERGVYRFYTFSDDGSRLLIDGHEVVDNDGSGSPRRKDGKIALEAGWHELKVLYFESYMGQVLEVGFSSKEIRETTLSESMLFVPQ
ncbi:metallophosphoesterase [Tannerella forsythia]|uniref:PA14 domain protein n=1 Tax=Tannerella forsythia TaxID=28112 RepID=A0A1D3UEQ9_TANFO|nr:metallophosphoesterase [Tannerella forsythia]SCQ18610.1 PA14 domain protein [Tannerella forsythia]